MRSPGLSLIAVASLVGCTETGAHLTLSAPAGTTAATFQVVLATPDQIPSVRDQRIVPGDSATTTVSYFLQRTVAGVESDELGKVDGFTIRIAPDTSLTETQFIPFVLMYDAGHSITGIGTFAAGEGGMPAAILVMRDEIDQYRLTVEPTTQSADDNAELAPGGVRVVTCAHADQTTFTSGIVWRTLAGAEYRLLMPDDGTLDATGRALDMDCDGHEVTPQSSNKDCDDTRELYHRDARDVCDGYDTNCDGAQTIASNCTTGLDCTNPFQVSGIQLCNDETKETTDCSATAACLCAAGTTAGCRFCSVPIEHGQSDPNASGVFHPCQPAIGVLSTYQKCTAAEPCDVEVVGVRGGWKIEVSTSQSNSFGPRANGVGATFAIKAKRPEGASYEVTGTNGMPVADIDLAFITSNGTEYVPVQLRLADNLTTCSSSSMLTCY